MKREARRIHGELTDDEQSRLNRLRAEVAREIPDLIQSDQLRKDAAAEDTTSGALRRAIHKSDFTLAEIAQRIGVTSRQLDEFLTGESTLASDVIDRLAETVGCKLVPVE